MAAAQFGYNLYQNVIPIPAQIGDFDLETCSRGHHIAPMQKLQLSKSQSRLIATFIKTKYCRYTDLLGS